MPTSIFDEIKDERAYQDGKWGSNFDKRNTLNDWVTYIIQYLGKASKMDAPVSEQRKHLVKVAALAVAALETCDRNGGFADRHYD